MIWDHQLAHVGLSDQEVIMIVGFNKGYSSSNGHFDSVREYRPQGGRLPYVNGHLDGLIPNHWAASDLSHLGMRNTENDGYSYYPDYSSMACGANGYTVFRPSNNY